MSGVIVNLDCDFLPHLIERLAELAHVGGSYAAVLVTEDSEDGCMDCLQPLGVCCQVSVVDDVGSECRFRECNIEGVTASDAPSDSAYAVFHYYHYYFTFAVRREIRKRRADRAGRGLRGGRA
jgi:hypothetical protein